MHLSSIKRPEIEAKAVKRADRVVVHCNEPTPLHVAAKDVVIEEKVEGRGWQLAVARVSGEMLFRRDAKVLRRLREDRALFVDRLGELRWPTGVGNLGSHDKAVVDERIGVHHGPDVRGDALA